MDHQPPCQFVKLNFTYKLLKTKYQSQNEWKSPKARECDKAPMEITFFPYQVGTELRYVPEQNEEIQLSILNGNITTMSLSNAICNFT